MSGKLPWMKFCPGDFMQDTVTLSLLATGAWIKILCAMWHKSERGKLTLSIAEYCRLLGAKEDETVAVIDELVKTGISDTVTEPNKNVTLICRRMIREHKNHLNNALRQQRFRVTHSSNALVTGEKSEVRSQKSEIRSQRREEKSSPSPAAPVAFEQFWKVYPRKIGKQAALRIWQRNKLDGRLDAILKALDWQTKSEQWLTEAGRYIPHPATWLNQGRWDDEPPKPVSRSYVGKPPGKREIYDRAVRDIVIELHKRSATLKGRDWNDYIAGLRDKYRDMPGALGEAMEIYRTQRRMAEKKTEGEITVESKREDK
jgi:hypothetical protein